MHKKLSAYFSGFAIGLLILLIFNLIKSYYKYTPIPETVMQDIKSKPLIYTEHSECRMKCRNITTEDVQEVLNSGKINLKKSNSESTPCPTYALEGVTKDDKQIRIILSLCDASSRLLTAIDLKNDNDNCECDNKAM